jgi:hypothetical protein
MDLSQIETDLQNSDFQYRLKAISALQDYPADVAVPLLNRHVQDPEFLVRTFVARELGKQQTSESFAALLQIMKFDNTPNVLIWQNFCFSFGTDICPGRSLVGTSQYFGSFSRNGLPGRSYRSLSAGIRS